MKRIVCEWEGPQIQGLAVTVLHFDDTVTSPSAAALAAFQAAQPIVPGQVTITVPTSGDIFDPSTGTITGYWSAPSDGGTVTGSTTSNVAAGVGACVTWSTSDVKNGRRVKGRTFWVPLPSAYYEQDGTIMATALEELDDFAVALTTSGLQVWSRPSTSGGSDGSAHDVVTYRIRDKVAVLTSRRD